MGVVCLRSLLVMLLWSIHISQHWKSKQFWSEIYSHNSCLIFSNWLKRTKCLLLLCGRCWYGGLWIWVLRWGARGARCWYWESILQFKRYFQQLFLLLLLFSVFEFGKVSSFLDYKLIRSNLNLCSVFGYFCQKLDCTFLC